jgi:hypothetical protein
MNLYLGNDPIQNREPENLRKAEKQPLFHVKFKKRQTQCNRLFNLVLGLFSAAS